MKTIEQIAEEIIDREGGYVNDPDDPGGATNFGVTIGTMTRLGMDLTGDGRVTSDDVKRLSRDQARVIFINHYFMNEMGQRIDVDGAIGPITIEAAKIAHASAPDHLADAYGIARRNYYYALADRRPASRKFARRRDGGKGGWIRRAEEFISSRYRLSEAEHRQRVAAWG